MVVAQPEDLSPILKSILEPCRYLGVCQPAAGDLQHKLDDLLIISDDEPATANPQ